jgi:hypothetical protein
MNGVYSCSAIIPRNNIVFFMPHGDPFAFKRTVDSEMQLKQRDDRDPEQGPRPEPGDNLIIMATVIGIIAGCIAGGLIGYHVIGANALVHGIIGGIIGGGILGSSIGNYMKKRARRNM